jgi:hypothetical protein
MSAKMKFSGGTGLPERRHKRASWPGWVMASEKGLEEDLGRDAVELATAFDVFGYVGEDLVEVRDGGGEVR